jgi:hypothetical protein
LGTAETVKWVIFRWLAARDFFLFLVSFYCAWLAWARAGRIGTIMTVQTVPMDISGFGRTSKQALGNDLRKGFLERRISPFLVGIIVFSDFLW